MYYYPQRASRREKEELELDKEIGNYAHAHTHSGISVTRGNGLFNN